MYASTTVVATLQGAFSDVGYMLAVCSSVLLAGAVALFGLGFGMRSIQTHVVGHASMKMNGHITDHVTRDLGDEI